MTFLHKNHPLIPAPRDEAITVEVWRPIGEPENFGRSGMREYGYIQRQLFAFARYVLDRLLGPRTRADELYDLRRRLLEQDGPGVASRAETHLALTLRRQREELMATFDTVEACSRCVRPRSTNWPGGHCCSGHTRELFSDLELSALKLAGTTPAHLKPPPTAHAGCAFRGPRGCSLKVAHRPNLCVRYACPELQRELEQRENGRTIARMQQELRANFARFTELWEARREASRFAELRASLDRHASQR